MTINGVTHRHEAPRVPVGPAGNGAAVVPEWEDAELLRLMAAARARNRGTARRAG